MEVLKINGKAYPGKITSYKGTRIDVDGDGAGTTESGYTVRDVRRRNKAKLMVKFENLSREEFSNLMAAVEADEIEVEYFCGKYQTITAYAGDRNWELVHASEGSGSLWKLETSFIEY